MIPLARVALLRLVRDRTNLFFVVIFPLLLVLLIGVTFGSAEGGVTLLVAGDDAGTVDALVEALGDDGIEARSADEDAARAAVLDGDADGAVVVSGSADGPAQVVVIAVPDGNELALQTRVEGAVAEVRGPVRSLDALASLGVEVDPALVRGMDSGVELRETVVDSGADPLAEEFAGLGQFDIGASSQLLLFVFITALASAGGVVQARRWGILDRVLAGPTRPGAVVAGLALGQLLVALAQALLIVVATSLMFGVNWGDPVASGAIMLFFAATAAASGLLLGALLDSEEQVGGIAAPVALVLAALGGSMLPLELFPDWLRPIANLTPHAWGNTAFAEIVRRGAGVVDILPNLAVLAAFTIAIGSAAALVLRRGLARG